MVHLAERGRYIVLHLKDGRRIYGWPQQWPSDSSTGHFELMESRWLEGPPTTQQDVLKEDQNSSEARPKSGSLMIVDSILVSAVDVEIVEILKFLEEIGSGPEANQSTAA
jgi:hypothetical protein